MVSTCFSVLVCCSILKWPKNVRCKVHLSASERRDLAFRFMEHLFESHFKSVYINKKISAGRQTSPEKTQRKLHGACGMSPPRTKYEYKIYNIRKVKDKSDR